MEITPDLIRSTAQALTATYGRPPTIEEIARAISVIFEITEALTGDRFEFLPPVDLAIGGAPADDYHRPRPRLEVVE
jgi:hypothetical protein